MCQNLYFYFFLPFVEEERKVLEEERLIVFSSGKSSRAETARESTGPEEDNTEKINETARDKKDEESETKEDKKNEKKREKKKKKKGLHSVSIGTVASIPNFSNIKSKVNSKPNKDYRPSEGR